MGCFDSCMKCLGRVPYASLISTILVMCGVGVFCGTLYKALEYSLKILTEILHMDIRGLDIVQKCAIAVGVTMGVIALILLLIGFLSTGATREMVYSGAKARVGGKCSLAFFMVLSYILNFIWMCVLAVMVVLTFIFGALYGYCMQGIPDNTTLNLNDWTFLFGNATLRSDDRYIIEKPNLDRFCSLSKDAFPMYIAAVCAAFIIVLGLIHFLICIAANYAHIKDGQKLQEYEEARYLEEQELGSLAKSSYR